MNTPTYKRGQVVEITEVTPTSAWYSEGVRELLTGTKIQLTEDAEFYLGSGSDNSFLYILGFDISGKYVKGHRITVCGCKVRRIPKVVAHHLPNYVTPERREHNGTL